MCVCIFPFINDNLSNYNNYIDHILKNANEVINGKSNGYYELIGENGWSFVGNVIEGKINGIVQIYDADGKLALEGELKDGSLNGYISVKKGDVLLGYGNHNKDKILNRNQKSFLNYSKGELMRGKKYYYT